MPLQSGLVNNSQSLVKVLNLDKAHKIKMKNLVILVSGSGTNLQRIIDTIDSGEIQNAKVSLVVADRECYGLERAKKHNIETALIPRGKNFSSDLGKIIPENTDLIVLAGFLSILKPEFVESWENKIINIHPALLPKYGGKGMWGHHVHNAIIEAKEKESGATVHFVTVGIDEGEAILQKSFEVTENDTPETLAEKVHKIEYEIFPIAINKVLGNN
jgi:phosphoribosylglycinamide formyltransferase-1